MSMAQTAFRTRPAFYRHSTAAARQSRRATTPLFQAFLRPSSVKATDGLCIKDATTIDFACGTGEFLTSWLKELNGKVKTTADREKMLNSVYGIEKKQFPYVLCITNMLLHDIDISNIYHDNSLLRDVLDYTERDQFDVILTNPQESYTSIKIRIL